LDKRGRTALRSGYTTGACAAAASKAAVLKLLGAPVKKKVEIPFPDGSRVEFKLDGVKKINGLSASASVIKDAGDDPDVTNGAEIAASARIITGANDIVIKGGEGVGVVTRPGLAVPPGEHAINPVPKKMITAGVREAIAESGSPGVSVEVTISVPRGRELAKKTLNRRLGIEGGISILGTTGIVRPLSDIAWKATISASMDVARAMGLNEVVLSSGRTSEAAHMRKYGFPEQAYALSGDFVEWSLREAGGRGFFNPARTCVAKMLKIAMGTPDTHVRAGAIDLKKAVEYLKTLGIPGFPREETYNTARMMMEEIPPEWLKRVCEGARDYAERVSGLPVKVSLAGYDGVIIAESE
jgi:cobalt-precorrin-5B (C1)-methyltransferase